jgi:hypothetical protein
MRQVSVQMRLGTVHEPLVYDLNNISYLKKKNQLQF